MIRSDQERRFADRLALETHTGPELSGGDVDADWAAAASVGEEAVGGSDDLGEALGVPRAPEDEFRTSGEILQGRDRYRWEDEDTAER